LTGESCCETAGTIAAVEEDIVVTLAIGSGRSEESVM